MEIKKKYIYSEISNKKYIFMRTFWIAWVSLNHAFHLHYLAKSCTFALLKWKQGFSYFYRFSKVSDYQFSINESILPPPNALHKSDRRLIVLILCNSLGLIFLFILEVIYNTEDYWLLISLFPGICFIFL